MWCVYQTFCIQITFIPFKKLSYYSPVSSRLTNKKKKKRHKNPNIFFQERLRPPTYNAEDYAQALRRWGRRALAHQQQQQQSNNNNINNNNNNNDANQNTLPSTCTSSSSGYASAGNGEMTLRQFTSVSELLNKLKADLKLAFPR